MPTRKWKLMIFIVWALKFRGYINFCWRNREKKLFGLRKVHKRNHKWNKSFSEIYEDYSSFSIRKSTLKKYVDKRSRLIAALKKAKYFEFLREEGEWRLYEVKENFWDEFVKCWNEVPENLLSDSPSGTLQIKDDSCFSPSSTASSDISDTAEDIQPSNCEQFSNLYASDPTNETVSMSEGDCQWSSSSPSSSSSGSDSDDFTSDSPMSSPIKNSDEDSLSNFLRNCMNTDSTRSSPLNEDQLLLSRILSDQHGLFCDSAQLNDEGGALQCSTENTELDLKSDFALPPFEDCVPLPLSEVASNTSIGINSSVNCFSGFDETRLFDELSAIDEPASKPAEAADELISPHFTSLEYGQNMQPQDFLSNNECQNGQVQEHDPVISLHVPDTEADTPTISWLLTAPSGLYLFSCQKIDGIGALHGTKPDSLNQCYFESLPVTDSV